MIKSLLKPNNLLGIGVLLIYVMGYYFWTEYREKVDRAISARRKTTVAITTRCTMDSRASVPTLHYMFFYKGYKYSDETSFDKKGLGDICKGYTYLVEFDSTHPMYNHILLDSPTDKSMY